MTLLILAASGGYFAALLHKAIRWVQDNPTPSPELERLRSQRWHEETYERWLWWDRKTPEEQHKYNMKYPM